MNSKILDVTVAKDEHANLDSLPLRFGFNFVEDTTIELNVISSKPDKNHSNREVLNATIHSPLTGLLEHGFFVVQTISQDSYKKLVTVWRNGIETEAGLSDLLRSMRSNGMIDVSWLKQKHAHYKAGKIRTSADLIDILVRERAAPSNAEVEAKYDLEKKDAKELEESIQRAEAQITQERQQALNKGSHLLENSPDVLWDVEENQFYRGSSCTVLSMSNGTKWYMKTSTFDKNNDVTEKAKSLIGNKVKITSWDPFNQPGKWSSQFYFRNIYLAQ